MDREQGEPKVERLAAILKVRLRSLDFILGAVRTMQGFLEGDD